MTVGDELFQCSSENKEKIDDVGIIEHGRSSNQADNKNHFSGKTCESWEMGVAKVDIDVVNLPLKKEKRIKN